MIQSLASFALLAASSVCVGGTPAGEPPIIKRKDEFTGKKYREQIYEGGTIAFTPDNLSIAQSYYLFGLDGNAEAEDLEVRCSFDTSGRILDYTCLPSHGVGIPPLLSVARQMGVFLATRSIGAQKPEKDPPRRVMRFIFHAEPPAAVKLDLESGQLVAQSQIQGFVPNSENAYPMRALREEAQGQQTFQCQIQADLSVICRTADFQPTENAQFFYGTERRLFARTKVLPELADGQPAIGVRFMYRINWRIPADEPDLETGK